MTDPTESPPPGGTPPHPPHPPVAPRRSAGWTIGIAVASMVAGAFAMRLLDRTVFKKEEDEDEDLAMLGESKAARALPPAPAPAPIPRPQIIRVEVPRGQRMPEEFWKRLAGGNDDQEYFDE